MQRFKSFCSFAITVAALALLYDKYVRTADLELKQQRQEAEAIWTVSGPYESRDLHRAAPGPLSDWYYLLDHPTMGRKEACYGELPHVLGEVPACVKGGLNSRGEYKYYKAEFWHTPASQPRQ